MLVTTTYLFLNVSEMLSLLSTVFNSGFASKDFFFIMCFENFKDLINYLEEVLGKINFKVVLLGFKLEICYHFGVVSLVRIGFSFLINGLVPLKCFICFYKIL